MLLNPDGGFQSRQRFNDDNKIFVTGILSMGIIVATLVSKAYHHSTFTKA